MTGEAVPVELQREVEQFLYAEARMLEDNRFDDWLACFSDDVRYLMPVRENVAPSVAIDAADRFAIYDDDKSSLRLRALRIQTGEAHAEIPLSVTQRLITNVIVAPLRQNEAHGRLLVRSNFMVYQERRGLHGSTYFGRRDDIISRAQGMLRIDARTILLAQSILPTTISIFF